MIYNRYIGIRLAEDVLDPELDILTSTPNREDTSHALTNKATLEYIDNFIIKEVIPIENGAVDIEIPELSFDGNLNPKIEINVISFRKTDLPLNIDSKFKLFLRYDGTVWKINRHDDYFPDGIIDGLEFSINSNANICNVFYSSSSLAGNNDNLRSQMYLEIKPSWISGWLPFLKRKEKNIVNNTNKISFFGRIRKWLGL